MLQQMGVLQNLNSVPVDMTLSGLGALQNAQQADQMTLANQQRQLDYNTANDPLALEASRLSNQGALARLPGIEADSQMSQRKNKMEEIMHEQQIAEMRNKYKDAEIKRYIQGLSQAGEVMRNAGEIIFQSPLGGNLRAKQMLEQAGAANLWNPEWDNMRPDQLAQKLHEIGKAFQENGSKYSQALDVTGMKVDAAADKAEADRASRERMQRERLEAARQRQSERADAAEKAAKWKRDNAGNKEPKNYEGLAAFYERLADKAMEDDDVEGAMKYKQQATDATARALQLKGEAARISAEGGLDLGALNNPNVQPRQVSPAVPVGPNTPRQPAPAASAPSRQNQFRVIRD